MSPAMVAAIGGVLGPLLVFITWLLARPTEQRTASAEVMTRTLEGALSTTETMRLLLGPLEKEIAELRAEISEQKAEIVTLRVHISGLEEQIREMGGTPKPIEFPPLGRMK